VVPSRALRDRRWDPAYWQAPAADALSVCALPCRPLGDFIDRITYGPILTGQRPEPAARGVTIIDQAAVRATGVVLDKAVTVAEGCAYDLPRCRLRRGDIVLCRSGAGTLAKRRFCVFDRRLKATVSCFVDLIRLHDINPYYAVTFLRSPLGWAQIDLLINGVGTPNLSFGEIRSLRIPLLPSGEQAALEGAWAAIRRLHRRRRLDAAAQALEGVVAGLDRRLRTS